MSLFSRNIHRQRVEHKEDEKSFKSSMDRAWLSLPGVWYDRNCTSCPVNRSVLYGNTVLLCKEFKETARLVHRNKSLQEPSGQFCSEKSHDNGNKMQDHWNGDGSHGNRLYLHEKCTNRKNLYRNRVGVPPVIFFPESENVKTGRRITIWRRSGIVR